MAVRYALARKKAHELRTHGKVKHAPVPVEALAELVGAVIRYEPFPGDLSGMVHRGPDGKIVIGVNSIHPENRRRFTIAHELGHLLLHQSDNFHVDERFPIDFRTEVSSLAVDPKEIEANQFAAELLMPIEFLAKDLKNLSLDIETEDAIKNLADRYQVSLQALTIRLSRLGIIR